MNYNFGALFYILSIFIFIFIFRIIAKRSLKSTIELRDDGFFYKNSFIEATGLYSGIKKISLNKNFFGADLRIEGAIEVRQKFFGASARRVIQISDLSVKIAIKVFADINCKIMERERFQSEGG
jgi:hypothetical protein